MDIENKYLKVTVNEHASLTSIFAKHINKEIIYQIDKRSWNGQDVVIFPIIARLKDEYYTYKNVKYSLKSHGLARYNSFNVVKSTANEMVLEYKYNEESLKSYPFKFLLRVSYALDKNKLTVTKEVINLDNQTIYFMLGSHPAFKVSGNENNVGFTYENVILDFDKHLKTKQYILNDEGNQYTGETKSFEFKKYNLSKEDITPDKTVILENNGVNSVYLETNDYKLSFDLGKAPIIALWTKPGYGDFLCIEPWYGLIDKDEAIFDITKKERINALAVNSSFKCSYFVTIDEN